MAGQTQVNGFNGHAKSRSYVGKTITGITIDYGVNGTDFSSAAETGAGGAHTLIVQKLQQYGTIAMMSALRSDGSNDGQIFDVFYEGEFGTDTYDGSTSQAFHAFVQAEIRAETSIGAGSVNLSSAAVTAMSGSPWKAEDAEGGTA